MHKHNTMDWLRENWRQHGPEWVKAHKADCDRALGHEVSWETWARSIRKIQHEWSISHPSPVESHEVHSEDTAEVYHDVDPVGWQADSMTVNTWGSPGNANQQVKIRYGVRKDLAPADFATAFKEAVEGYSPVLPMVPIPDAKSGLVAEPCLFDFHLGRGSWDSIAEASEAYMDALSDLMRGYSSGEFSKVIFPIGHDFLDWDNWHKTTTAGTQMRGADPPDKIIKAGFELLVQAVDILSTYGEVDVIVVPGNHDWLLSHMLGLMLASWYKDSKSVSVDADLKEWKFRTGENWLLALTHGKHPDTKRAMKPEDLAAALPLKAPDLWRSGQYREVQTGHLHHRSKGFVPVVVDEMSTVVRRVGSLAKQDSYEKVNNYVSNREAELIVFDSRGPCDFRSHRP